MMRILEILFNGGIMMKNPALQPLLIDILDTNPNTRYYYPDRKLVDMMVSVGVLDESWNITDLGRVVWRDQKISFFID